MADKEKKMIELWDGFEVELDDSLMNDFDFANELNEATQAQNIGLITEMYMAMVGGDATYDAMREHLTKKEGRMTVDGVAEVLEKIQDALPKSGNRAQRRSWKNSR